VAAAPPRRRAGADHRVEHRVCADLGWVFVDESGAREMCWSTKLVLVMEAGGFDVQS
jgi:hypothetical protein